MVHAIDKDNPVLGERFWSKVNKTDGCWLWTASIDLKGYGQFGIGGSGNIGLAHRLSYAAVNGPIPKDKEILHRCDNPACVRPDHMRLGTHAENMAEMSQRRRGNHGERHTRSHLSDEAINVIRFLAARGYNYDRLGAAYGIANFGVSCIARGTTWKHLPGPFTFRKRGYKQPLTVFAELPAHPPTY